MSEDYLEEEEEESEKLDFENDPNFAHLPPLDRLRKSRRDILRSINEIRQGRKLTVVHTDHTMIWVASEYAEHILQSGGQDETILEELIDKYDAVGAEGTNAKEYTCLVGEAFYDAETGDEKELAEAFMDAHGLLFELEEELTALLRKDITHVGIGFAYSQNMVRVVEILGKKEIKITQLSATEDEGVEVRGSVFDNETFGLYAIRICGKKTVSIVGPQDIQMDTSSWTFVGTFTGPLEEVFYAEEPKSVEFYLRVKPESIPYGE